MERPPRQVPSWNGNPTNAKIVKEKKFTYLTFIGIPQTKLFSVWKCVIKGLNRNACIKFQTSRIPFLLTNIFHYLLMKYELLWFFLHHCTITAKNIHKSELIRCISLLCTICQGRNTTSKYKNEIHLRVKCPNESKKNNAEWSKFSESEKNVNRYEVQYVQPKLSKKKLREL